MLNMTFINHDFVYRGEGGWHCTPLSPSFFLPQLSLRLKAMKRQVEEAEEEIDRLESSKKKLQRELEEQLDVNEHLQGQLNSMKKDLRWAKSWPSVALCTVQRNPVCCPYSGVNWVGTVLVAIRGSLSLSRQSSLNLLSEGGSSDFYPQRVVCSQASLARSRDKDGRA